MNKGAISSIISTVLLVLITVVLIGIIAVVVMNINQNTSEQISEEFHSLVEKLGGEDRSYNNLTEICGDGIDNDGDGEIDEDCIGDYILTTWPIYLDICAYNECEDGAENWGLVKSKLTNMKDYGFTHAGVGIYGIQNLEMPGVLSKISELRGLGFNFAIERAGDSEGLTGREEIRRGFDPENHSSNELNKKYFDTFGLVLSISNVNYSYCIIDPSYEGILWNNSLTNLNDTLQTFGHNNYDMVVLDFELWIHPEKNEIGVGGCGGIFGRYFISNSTRCGDNPINNPEHNRTIAYANYIEHWRKKGRELKEVVMENAPNRKLLLWGQAGDYRFNVSQDGYWPTGSGDYPNKAYYDLPNLTLFAERLENMKPDLPTSIIATSFIWNNARNKIDTAAEVSVNYRGYEIFDAKISQKAGYMLRNAGVKGAYIWPGIDYGIYQFSKNAGSFEDYSEFLDYFDLHAKAFTDGYLKGIDPGELIEICGDGIDNDGDARIDECDDGCACEFGVCNNGICQQEVGADFIIAAFDATNIEKGRADYLADGDGDEEQINSAIAALPPEGGTILLSSGTFVLSNKNIKINRSNIQFIGTSNTTVIRAANNYAAYDYDSYMMIALYDYPNIIKNISIKNIYFDGNRQNLVQDQNMVVIKWAEGVYIQNCTFANPYHLALLLYNDSENIQVKECKFTGDVSALTGAYVYSSGSNINAIFESCYFSQLSDNQAFYIQDGTIKCNKCNFQSVRTAFDVRGGGKNCELTNSLLNGGTSFAFISQLGSISRQIGIPLNTLISGNTIINHTGIVMQDMGINTRIIDNDITQTGTQLHQLLILRGTNTFVENNVLRSNGVIGNMAAIELMNIYGEVADNIHINNNDVLNAKSFVWNCYNLSKVNYASDNRIQSGFQKYMVDTYTGSYNEIGSSPYLNENNNTLIDL